jgi:hypothetical protein
MRPIRFFVLLPLLIAACAPSGAEVAAEGKRRLVGMTTDDFQACAGIPTRTQPLSDGTSLLSYEEKNGNVGGFNVSLPLVGGGFRLAGSGSYCEMLVRVAQGKVIGLNYTGDDDDVGGQDGVCAPIVRGCLRQPAPASPPPND